jgi:hypothetical protein
MEDYLDDHKENAFKSAFQEPARYYFHYKKKPEQWVEENVETHGNNWYLLLLHHPSFFYCTTGTATTTTTITVTTIVTTITATTTTTTIITTVNRYLAMLNSALAVHLPMLPAYWDDWPEVCCDFWVGLNEDCWAEFSKKGQSLSPSILLVLRSIGLSIFDLRQFSRGC